jgi:hypothetical protein
VRGAEIVFIDLVFAEVVLYAGGIEDARSIGFSRHTYDSNSGRMVSSSGGIGSTGRPACRHALRPPRITAT